MKEVIMIPTLSKKSQEEIVGLINSGFIPKKTKEGVEYLVRNKNFDTSLDRYT